MESGNFEAPYSRVSIIRGLEKFDVVTMTEEVELLLKA
jgi:hypothetical protein